VTSTTAEKDQAGAEKIRQLRELFADAPKLGKKALENALREISSQVSGTPPPAIEGAGRVFDNDTRMLFATSFDGDWHAYIDEFVTMSQLPGHHRLRVGRLARHPQSGSEGLPRRAPDHGRGLVRGPSGSDASGHSPAQAHRQGGGRVARQGWLSHTNATSKTEKQT
jgi:hypothetical protein